ncbi:hypothetical protein CDAR_185491 [Caerostris darwini]|uniref:Uncharacterized protein n=1 Tax=Caerostris darwini TaxID=1538125 RepID=A0AAV4QPL4_9ARAC|nr:hypothetical protein CDAR_185491 [Caerostris darwini]
MPCEQHHSKFVPFAPTALLRRCYATNENRVTDENENSENRFVLATHERKKEKDKHQKAAPEINEERELPKNAFFNLQQRGE